MNKTTQPIKNRKKIDEILHYLKGKNYRDFLIAKMEFNTARRIGDIITLKVSDLMKEDGSFRKYISFNEDKTDKEAKVVINQPLQRVIKDYIHDKKLNYNDYLFPSRKGENQPLTTTQVHRIFQDVAQALNLDDFGTHSLRKTWGYFCYMETRNIGLIMKVFNHASEKETLRYIGITQEDMDVMYMNIKF